MKFKRFLVLFLVIIFLGTGLYKLISERKKFDSQVYQLNIDFKKLEAENKSLMAKIEYFKEPENLLKELKSQFNYRKEGENLIILVPGEGGGE